MIKDVVVAVIYHNNLVAIGKKRSDSTKALAGKWHIPGGNINDYEPDHLALKREALEELGLEITVRDYIGRSTSLTGKRVRWYECHSPSPILRPSDDLEDAKWVTLREAYEIVKDQSDRWSSEVLNYFER